MQVYGQLIIDLHAYLKLLKCVWIMNRVKSPPYLAKRSLWVLYIKKMDVVSSFTTVFDGHPSNISGSAANLS